MLTLSKSSDETWLAALLKLATPYHLEEEVKASYDEARRNGESEQAAARGAALEWNLLSDGDDDGPS